MRRPNLHYDSNGRGDSSPKQGQTVPLSRARGYYLQTFKYRKKAFSLSGERACPERCCGLHRNVEGEREHCSSRRPQVPGPAQELSDAQQGSSGRWVTLNYTSSHVMHFNGKKEECLGSTALVQPEFLLSFQVDPMEEAGSTGEKRVLVSLRTSWRGRINPRGQAADVRAPPATIAQWHRGGRKPGGFLQIPKDSQEAGIT